MVTKEALHTYLDEVFAGYIDDPADSDFQRGYLAAHAEIASWAGKDIPEEIKPQLTYP